MKHIKSKAEFEQLINDSDYKNAINTAQKRAKLFI